MPRPSKRISQNAASGLSLRALSRKRFSFSAPALIAVLAGIALLCSIDPAGSYPNAPQGPGLTLDETFNVQQGVLLVEGLREVAAGRLRLTQLFSDHPTDDKHPLAGRHNPDHPPLGRAWIGLGHQITKSWVPPQNPQTPFVAACARSAPATAFSVLVFLVGCTATRWYGFPGGLCAAISLVLMPRLFGHAHLAALETFIALTYTAAVLCIAVYWTRTSHGSGKPRPVVAPRSVTIGRRFSIDPPSWRIAAYTGIVFGLALLTKIQAVLLPVPIALWAFYHWRNRAVIPLLIWAAIGLLVFFLLWPWLWLNPIDHLREYVGRATDRSSLHTWYLGRRFADHAVPWHYPFVMFLVTVPVGLHLLGFWGLFAQRAESQRRQSDNRTIGQSDNRTSGAGDNPSVRLSDAPFVLFAFQQPREQLVLACMVFPLIVFALPGIAVYDGARLFLVVFPLWGLLIGRGAVLVMAWLIGRLPRWGVGIGLGLFLVLQGYGLAAMWPCHLSYYNLFVGGLRGAERLGFEVTYWGDSVTREFLEQTAQLVPQGSVIHVAPVLHQFQLEEMRNQSPILRRREIELRPFDGFGDPEVSHVMFFRRRADLPDPLRAPPPGLRLLSEVRRHRVQLAALYAVDASDDQHH